MSGRAAALLLAATACLESPPDSSGDPSLLAAFSFEDDTDFLLDSSGNGHDGACASDACPRATAARDDLGRAAQFDGVDDMVSIEPVGDGPFTIMLWLRMDFDPGEVAACPISKVFGGDGANSWQLCMPVAPPDAAVLAFFTSDDPSRLTATIALELGSWHHVAIRWDGVLKSIWWDGIELAEEPGTTRFDAGPVLVGGDIDGSIAVSFFPGVVDDVELHAGALPPAAIGEAARP